MKIGRSALTFILLAMITITFVPVGGQVNAASKKTVYVVKSVKIQTNGKKYTVKFSYNKDGLLSSSVTPSNGLNITNTYGKKGEIKSHTEKITSGKMKGAKLSATYTWKNGKMVKKTITNSKPGSAGDERITHTLTYKGKKVVKSHIIDQYFNDEGKQESHAYDVKYTYKNGKVVKLEESNNATFKYDKKDNLIEIKLRLKQEDGTILTPTLYKARISYKNKRVHMMKTEDLTSTMDKTVKSTQTYSYKKIKVSKSLADKIEMQQWALINAVITDGVPW